MTAAPRDLVHETADLAPGTALDLGCGEGADAIWLAQRGWRVTAVDISQVALDRAAGHAAAAHVEMPREKIFCALPPRSSPRTACSSSARTACRPPAWTTLSSSAG